MLSITYCIERQKGSFILWNCFLLIFVQEISRSKMAYAFSGLQIVWVNTKGVSSKMDCNICSWNIYQKNTVYLCKAENLWKFRIYFVRRSILVLLLQAPLVTASTSCQPVITYINTDVPIKNLMWLAHGLLYLTT